MNIVNNMPKNKIILFAMLALVIAAGFFMGSVAQTEAFQIDDPRFFEFDGVGGSYSYTTSGTFDYSYSSNTSYIGASSTCGNSDPIDLNGDGMFSQDEVGCSCTFNTPGGGYEFKYPKGEPSPICTIDLTASKLAWTTSNATVVLISPLTNSPQIPGLGSHTGAIKDIILSGDFWNTYWQVHKSKVAADAYANGGVSIGNAEPYANQSTADRLCSLLDPNARAIVWKADSYSSPENNSIILWNGYSWEKHGAKYYNKHLRYQFTCATFEDVDSYPLNGTHYFNPELGIGTHTYKLVAVGPGGSVECTDTITVKEPEPVPVCTLDLTRDKLTWATEHATNVDIKPLTNSPQIPGASGGGSSTGYTTILSGDFWNTFWQVHKSKVAADAYTYGSVYLGNAEPYANQATANRLCSLLDPNAVASVWKSDSYNTPKDNSMLMWNPNQNVWKKYPATQYNKHLRYQFTCVVPNNSGSTYPLSGTHYFDPVLWPGTHTYKLTATGPGGTEICTDTITITEPDPKGSIKVCKLIVDEDDNIVTGSANAGTFTISVAGFSVSFDTPLQFTHNLISDYHNYKDAECVLYDDLELGSYSYGEEQITGDNWQTPLYNDGFTMQVDELDDFLPYNPNGSNDADGEIVLTKERPHRVLAILNQYESEDEPEAPICDMDVSPYKIHEGDSAILSWTSTGADTVVIDQSIGSVNPNGSTSVSPDDTTTYTGTFTGPGGTVTCSAKLKVKDGGGGPTAPQCQLSANPASFAYGGGKTTISWTTTNANAGSVTDNVGDPDEKDLDPLGSGSFEVHVDTTTVFTAEVKGDGGTASCAVTVKVDKQSCSNCGGGGGGVPFDPHTSLTHRDVANPQPLTGQIYLNQVPYTGFATGPLGAAIFWIVILMISATLSYFVVQRNLLQSLFSFLAYSGAVVRGASGYTDQAETDFADYLGHQGVGAHHWNDTPADQASAAQQNYNLSHGAGLGSLSGGSSDITQQLEERAHKDNILISSEGLSTIISQSAGVDSQAIALLEQVLEKAKELYPREDGWILLNSERVQTILSQLGGGASMAQSAPTYDTPSPSMQTAAPVQNDEPAPYTPSSSYSAPVDDQPASYTPPTAPQDDYASAAPAPAYEPQQTAPAYTPPAASPIGDPVTSDTPEMRDVPTFVDHLLNGRENEAFTFLRSLSAEGRNEREFLTQVVVALDSVYKYRIEGGMRPDAAVLAKVEKIGTQTLERILEILADCVDHSYSSPKLGAKIAVTKVFECLAGKL